MPSNFRTPLNLTEAAERARWFEAERIVPALSSGMSSTFEIEAVNISEAGYQSQGLSDEACVVVSGYGVLRYGAEEIQCTAGDLLFIPAGAPHCFERLNGVFKIWWIQAHIPQ